MKEYEKTPTGLVFPTDELRRLMMENPDLPLVVLAGEEANPDREYTYMFCGSVRANLGEFLDCNQAVNDECSYFDRDEFEEDLEEKLADEAPAGMIEEDFQALLKKELAEYEPYWKPCIILTVNN